MPQLSAQHKPLVPRTEGAVLMSLTLNTWPYQLRHGALPSTLLDAPPRVWAFRLDDDPWPVVTTATYAQALAWAMRQARHTVTVLACTEGQCQK